MRIWRVGLVAQLLTAVAMLSCSGSGPLPDPSTGSGVPSKIEYFVRLSSINASYEHTASISALVTDKDNQPVPDGTQIRYEINSSSLPSVSEASFSLDKGKTSFTAATINGFCTAVLNLNGQITQPSAKVTVTAKSVDMEGVYKNVDLVFFSDEGMSFSLTLTADSSQIEGNGQSGTRIRARIENAFGMPPQGPVEIAFSSIPESAGSLDSAVAVTDANGEASVVFTGAPSAADASALVMAKASVAVEGLPDVVDISDLASVSVLYQSVARMNLISSENTLFTAQLPGLLPGKATIVAYVYDNDGLPISDGTLIKFSARDHYTGDPIGYITPFALTKDGVATAILAGGLKAGLAEVRAEDPSGTVIVIIIIEIRTDLVILPLVDAPGDSEITTGIEGRPYAFRLAALVAGGVAPYSFSIQQGSLPSGLSLTSEGDILGTPQENGTFTFKLRVQDYVGNEVFAVFLIRVINRGLFIVPATYTFTAGSAEGLELIAKVIAPDGTEYEDHTKEYSWNLQENGIDPAGAFSLDANNGTHAVLAYDGQAIVTGGTVTVTVQASNGESAFFIGVLQAGP